MAMSAVETVKSMDQCWLQNDFTGLARHFHADALLLHASGQHRLSGCDAITESYVGFMAANEVRSYETTNFVSHHVAGLVIVSYDWSMAWTEMSGLQRHTANGHESLTLCRQDDRWVIACRLQSED